MSFTPTRQAALGQLAEFVPKAPDYSDTRNFDTGLEGHPGVSRLSPYIRTRLLTEEEITGAVLEKNSAQASGKFLQEVAWRTYWKGWLEMRPGVWDRYCESLGLIEKDDRYETAVSGTTGIACFDHWTSELVETGYLHNHARMWFASIWIFTLGLPWQLGAEFFLKHLLDADPASNTLSWRWVAGLHTKGKHYLARASNIERFTRGRFNPAGQLNESAPPISWNGDFEAERLDLPENPVAGDRTGHLMFPEDLAPLPESVGVARSVAAFIPPVLETTPLVARFLNGAVNDSLNRMSGTRLAVDFASALNDWVSAKKLDTVLVSLPTVGPTRDFLAGLELPVPLKPFVREWDRTLWPKATAGFFKFRKGLPEIHAAMAAGCGKL